MFLFLFLLELLLLLLSFLLQKLGIVVVIVCTDDDDDEDDDDDRDRDKDEANESINPSAVVILESAHLLRRRKRPHRCNIFFFEGFILGNSSKENEENALLTCTRMRIHINIFI